MSLATTQHDGPALRALVVEDDPGIADFVRLGLRYEAFEVQVCGDGLSAIRAAEQSHPDVVVLDRMLPGMDGLDVCKRLRAQGDAAIVMLTARDSLGDRVADLETGADDYVVKPFHFEELVARIRAVLRRRATRSTTVLRFADLELNPITRKVGRGDRSLALTPREFELLRVLLEQPRRVFSKRALVERVWGYDFAGDDNIVEVYIGYLRDKLADRPPTQLIRTVRGVGYALSDE
ncbi:MAG: response regulator transcription factor [Chloroflexi bacterium]|nr:response regulator transcription factor [Chloroflexota bacterium]